MKEEIIDSDDYVNWIQWVFDAEQGKHVISITAKQEDAHVLLQLQQMNGDIFPNKSTMQVPVPDDYKTNSRWEEISQKIQVDQSLDEEKGLQFWKTLECYQDVFAWNKKELGCCTIGEHSIDTQGYPPCKMSPG
jgi:hypothetical protein